MNFANFIETCRVLRATSTAAIVSLVFADIEHEYNMSYRHYHNKSHIEDCQAELKQIIADDAKLLDLYEIAIISFAIYYHDIVMLYQNYVCSCEWLSTQRSEYDCLRLGIDSNVQRDARLLILATELSRQTTQLFLTSSKQKIIADIDISVFGKNMQDLLEVEQQIRQEHFYVPNDLYIKERTKILQSFLDRPHVYHTPYFCEKYEKIAIDNLKELIISLKE